jgi:uncharacterized protein YndB with AHSA1/START domain
MKELTKVYEIHATIEKVWQALTDPSLIKEWLGDKVVMDDTEGTNFELWGGSIHGTNTKVIKDKELDQDWYSDSDTTWEEPSKVVFTLEDLGESTKVTLTHTNIPDSEAASIDSGWDEYYLGAIKEFLEEE